MTNLAEARSEHRCSGRGGFGGGSSLLKDDASPLSRTSSLDLEVLLAAILFVCFRISFSRGVSGMSGREDLWGLKVDVLMK